MTEMKKMRFIISGGGTGGHIFPAISIANALKGKCPDAEFLFVGAESRMEMEYVPAAGYEIIGLPIIGFDRKSLLKNFKTVFFICKSLLKSRKIIKKFKPDAAIGVGGFASGPLLYAAAGLNVPALIQEQNSYAGVTNKLLAKKVSKICVAYSGMGRFFPEDKIVLTGNPVRQNLAAGKELKNKGMEKFGLVPEKKTILIVGGSLGARTVNESVMAFVDEIEKSGVQVIWQTGRYYYKEMMERLKGRDLKNIVITEFVRDMNLAYSVADLVVSRAGASSISELCILKKPVILVPSPNVAEDHQTKNALALVNEDAAVMVKDADAKETLILQSLKLVADDGKLKQLSNNIGKMAQLNSADRIAEEVLKIVGNNEK